MKNNLGFTLAELLIVITILVIIGTTLLMTINPLAQFLRGYDAVRKADLAKLKITFESYYSDHDCYPTLDKLSQCGSNALAPYLTEVPCDPNTNTPYTPPYTIEELNVTCPQKYAIYATLSNKLDPQGDEIRFCPDKIVAGSSDLREADIIKGGCNKTFQNTYYGCNQGSCILVAQNNDPYPPPDRCNKTWVNVSTCGTRNECTQKGPGAAPNYGYKYFCQP